MMTKKQRRALIQHKYYEKNKERLLLEKRNYILKNRDKFHSYRKKFRKKHPDMVNAWAAVSREVRRKSIPKASDFLCGCGKIAKHYHHYAGYSYEHRIDVEPLCEGCHIEISKRGE